MKQKEGHSKMNNVDYQALKTQSYFHLEGIRMNEVQNVFKYRTRMTNVGANYRGRGGNTLCPLCNKYLDRQEHMFECEVLKDTNQTEDDTNVYKQDVTLEAAREVSKVVKYREQLLEEQKKENNI